LGKLRNYFGNLFTYAQQIGNSQNPNTQKDLGDFFSKMLEKFRVVLELKTDVENYKG
jgi:hypothetical protein